ncbi:hypothetical protein C0991_010832 [Blastosporella zonata]|nr:hypothetical protein C0991_010832 [Blastosporella zonata]
MRISLDIFDCIIDALGADHATIRNLCLTSRALVIPAQKRLFSSILLRIPQGHSTHFERCEALNELFHSNPILASHVRSLKLIGRVWPQTRDPLLPILHSLLLYGLLESFAFPIPYILDEHQNAIAIPADWHMIFPPIREALERIICLSSIQTIVVCVQRVPMSPPEAAMRRPRLNGLSDAILRVPRLKNVCFTFDDTPSLQYPTTARIRKHDSLPDIVQWKYLELGGDFAQTFALSIVKDALHHYFFSELRHLSLHPDSYHAGWEVASLCAQTLQTLVFLNPRMSRSGLTTSTLTIHSSEAQFATMMINLSSLVQLQTLVFIINMSALTREISAMCTILEQLRPAPSLKHLTLVIQLDKPDRLEALSSIEPHLVGQFEKTHYHGVRDFNIKIFDTGKRGEDGYKNVNLRTYLPAIWKLVRSRRKVAQQT